MGPPKFCPCYKLRMRVALKASISSPLPLQTYQDDDSNTKLSPATSSSKWSISEATEDYDDRESIHTHTTLDSRHAQQYPRRLNRHNIPPALSTCRDEDLDHYFDDAIQSPMVVTRITTTDSSASSSTLSWSSSSLSSSTIRTPTQSLPDSDSRPTNPNRRTLVRPGTPYEYPEPDPIPDFTTFLANTLRHERQRESQIRHTNYNPSAWSSSASSSSVHTSMNHANHHASYWSSSSSSNGSVPELVQHVPQPPLPQAPSNQTSEPLDPNTRSCLYDDGEDDDDDDEDQQSITKTFEPKDSAGQSSSLSLLNSSGWSCVARRSIRAEQRASAGGMF